MTTFPGATGLVFNEPPLWEMGKPGRCAADLPRRDVERRQIDNAVAGDPPDFPELSEPEIVRHYTRLSQWNFGVDSGMYPLGSCTMKYNPKLHEKLAAFRGFAELHPLSPDSLSQGALKVMSELERLLAEITGMQAVSLQPAAGAQGELAGMLLIHAYHKKKCGRRTKIIIPDTAHGTNPASAALCGYEPIPVKSNENGILSPESIAEAMDDQTAGIMVTNPNTLGLFEEHIKQIAEIVHRKGGLVYCDGANMNAVMGIVRMGEIGVDVLHLNLHKTFSTPHGGGGPGAGPICVRKHLEPFLPVPRVVERKGSYALSSDFPDSIGKLHSFYGNFSIMVRAHAYILSMGADLKRVSELAVLNANYIKERLKGTLHLAYDRPCMHECVFSDKLQKKHKVTTLDMVKRLIDYGFHPPTVYFPLVVDGAIMIEPTETESKETIDAFIEAFKTVAVEAEQYPDQLRRAPGRTKVRRLDETSAARHPCLGG
ncbi:MAG: glycine dehydrogenase subunit 2 [Candidatus Abyssobacteria bacterium SURF_5]|uniref:glycine dehydrogenase (aminomethyl-transferring) n=1 Tax=Abyssobacteria bacterium (strain SURF_5) TaxID=2093360 RepID=A0A3A4NQ18_ABYX5|nr:MAG: glycine dehydrogenase subunit 2 [Candidatus Abyssubacteria bacterium SURF_5]